MSSKRYLAKTMTTNQTTGYMKLSLVMLISAFAVLFTAASPAFARGAGESFADLAEDLSPAVVNIVTSIAVSEPIRQRPIVPEGSPLEDLFRDFQDQNGDEGPQFRGEALGSGFIISADGYIVTNNHVIVDADEITIEFFSGETMVAEVVGRDERTDIAVLKVTPDTPLPFVKFGDSDIARVGDWVMAVGNPLGQGFSVSAGIISARNRALSGVYDDFIQTDAAINKGNSGGPLFNMDGDVIGVNTAILSPSGGSIGLGFSMSSSVVSKVVDQLIEFGETRRGWLGVRIQNISEDIAEALELTSTDGALITDVPAGPSMDAGILPGDVIVTFDGKDVIDTRKLVSIVAETEVGKAVRVVVIREGKSQTILVTLGRLEEALLVSAAPEESPLDVEGNESEGLTLGALNPDNRATFGISEDVTGVLILDIDTNSDAFDKGLRPGDVINEIGQQTVTKPSDVVGRIAAARDAGRRSILFLIDRENDKRFVAIPLGE